MAAANNLPASGLPALPNAQPAIPPAAQGATTALRALAGPQLNPTTVPPWRRPGIPAGQGGHAPRWTTRAANWVIPLSQPLTTTPDINTRQDGVNTFLANLHGQFGSRAGLQGGQAAWIRASAGPRVFGYEVSSHDPNHRLGTFHNYRDPNQPNRYMAGTLPLPTGHAPMPLAEFSATVRDAVARTNLHAGTIYLCASREAPHQLRHHTAWRRYVASLPAHAQPPGGAAPNMNPGGGGPVTSDLWHNAAVFVQSRNDYPRRAPGYGDGSRATSQQWSFDGSYRRCFIYDPSFVNETFAAPPARGPATQQLHDHSHYRIGNFVFLRTVAELVFSNSHGFASRAAWIQWQLPVNRALILEHATVFLGGGGNAVGLDECRRMACVWMQQVAWLS